MVLVTLTVGRISTRRRVNGSMATAVLVAAKPRPIQLSSIRPLGVGTRDHDADGDERGVLSLAISRLFFQDI